LNRLLAIIVGLVSVVIVGLSLSIFPSENIQEEIQVQPTVRTLEPVTTQIEPASISFSTQEFEAESTVESIPPPLSSQSYDLFAKAYAISPSQSSITVQTWMGAIGQSHAFDSSRNHFSSSNGGREIAFIDITDDTKKTWVLPNDNRQQTNRDKMGVDSSGNLFFGQTDANDNFPKLARLIPSTDVFTEFDYGSNRIITHVIVTPSDEIFFVDGGGGVRKLDIVQNMILIWGENELDQFLSFETDFSGNFYATDGSGGKIYRININTNTLTTWDLSPNEVWAANVDSAGNIFFTESDGIRSKVGRIESDNTLTEWVIPNSGVQFLRDIEIDSAGTVFFTFNGLSRLVPSTDVFTEFSVDCNRFEIDSSDDIYCSGGNTFSKLT